MSAVGVSIAAAACGHAVLEVRISRCCRRDFDGFMGSAYAGTAQVRGGCSVVDRPMFNAGAG